MSGTNEAKSETKDEGLTRRETIAGLGAGLGAMAMAGGGGIAAIAATATEAEAKRKAAGGARQPVIYLPHGGGPWPFVDVGFGDKAELGELAAYLRSIRGLPKTPPRALLVVSAHWEEAVPTVMTSARPPMLYDYYGFPPDSYKITWPAPGEPELAARVRKLLGAAGFQTADNPSRGFDHGTFVPLKLAYPSADVPVVQLSLIKGLDPAQHLAMGRALGPLRDEGVFIVGSGMSYHDLRNFGPRGIPASEAFDAWLQKTVTLEPVERDRLLASWTEAPAARRAHPREEHLIPLMVIAGAAGSDRGSIGYSGTIVGLRISAHHFG